MNATGSQFMKACQSNVVQIAKQGENMMFDPSFIPPSHKELTIVGDILLTDAAVTHRGQYLQYLRKELLPSETKFLFSQFVVESRQLRRRLNFLAQHYVVKATIQKSLSPVLLLALIIRHKLILMKRSIKSI